MSAPPPTVGTMFHPWAALGEWEHVVVDWRDDLPDGMRGATNGHDIIWMDKKLIQVERRCTIAHEMVHIEQGHEYCQPPKVERQVRAVTARRLIRFEDFVDVSRWALSAGDAADCLWVTEQVLTDYIEALTEAERVIAWTARVRAFESAD